MTGALRDQLDTAAAKLRSVAVSAKSAADMEVSVALTEDLVARITRCTPCPELLIVPIQPVYAVLSRTGGTASCWDCFSSKPMRVTRCSDCDTEATGPLLQANGQVDHVFVTRMLCTPCVLGLIG